MNCLTLMKMASITDGTSNTYLLGEKYLIPDNYFDGEEATDNNPVYAGYRLGLSTLEHDESEARHAGAVRLLLLRQRARRAGSTWRFATARCIRFRLPSIP